MTKFAELFVRVMVVCLFLLCEGIRWHDRWLRSCAVLICENEAGGSISDLVLAVVVT